MGDRTARDVLADRIETWIEDNYKVYDYADRLINDLWTAGFGINPVDRLDRDLEEADRRIEGLLGQVAAIEDNRDRLKAIVDAARAWRDADELIGTGDTSEEDEDYDTEWTEAHDRLLVCLDAPDPRLVPAKVTPL